MKALIVTILLALSTTVYAEGDFKTYMQEAGEAFKAQESKQALEVLEKAMPLANTETEKAKVNNAIGWTYFSDDNNEKAKEHLEQALALSVESDNKRLAEKASNNLGIVEYTTENLDVAEKYFLNKWSKDSKTSTHYIELIKEQRKLNTVNASIAKGVSYFIDKDYENAVIEYNKALAIEPENVRALEHKGYSYYRLNKYDEAIVALKQAQSIEPDHVTVLINLMKTYCSSEKTELIKQLIEENKAVLIANSKVLQGDGELQKVCDKTLFDL
ncbi:MAG: tetratricopeptide repeat protein [Cocleimonas sp.]|nr:tetratricopeptide repeat protein [Cocleimonas sp.]